MRLFGILLAGMLLATGVSATAPPLEAQSDSTRTSVDRLVERYRTGRKIPGITIAVVRNGHVIKAKGYGTADLEPRELLVPHLVSTLAWVTAGVCAAVLVLGTIVTGSGPHSGDAEQPARTGFDPRSVAWLHADVVMLFVGLVVAVLVAVWLTSSSDRAKATWRGVLLVTLLQGAIGYVQYFTGLPEVLVGLHMLGASLLVVTMVLGVMNLRSNPL